MNRFLTLSILISGFALTTTAAPLDASRTTNAEQTRTIYFSAVDGKGAPVPGLTAADLVVKEGGKDQTVASVAPAEGPLQVEILDDDGGSGNFQGAVGIFIQGTYPDAEYAISLFNPQALKIMDHGNDPDAIKAAIGKLGQRGRLDQSGEQMIAAVSAAATDLAKRKAARPVILVTTTYPDPVQSSAADTALNDLRASGASLNVISSPGVQLGKVLTDGPRQSGGIMQSVGSNASVQQVLGKLVDQLKHQYVLTYTIPDGTKLKQAFALTTTKKGVTIIAPTRLSDS